MCIGLALTVAACGGDDDASEPQSEPVEIVNVADFVGAGTFEVTRGGDVLGCEAGTSQTVLTGHDDPAQPPIDATVTFTCTEGSASGTFTTFGVIDDELPGPGDVRSSWNLIESTGDFVDLTLQGTSSVEIGETTTTETLAGETAP